MKSDVVIVGAGALGVSLAFHLAEKGIQTVVLEQEAVPAAHASGKNAGMIRRLYRNPQLTDWAERSVKLWPGEIKSKTYRETGSLIVGRSLPGHHDDLFEERVLLLPAGEKTLALPAIFTESDGLLDSGSYINLLYQATEKKVAKFFFNTSVSSVEKRNAGWKVETSSGKTFEAGILVNAAGAWLNRFLEPHHNELTLGAQPYARHLYIVEGWDKDYMPAPGCGFFWDENAEWYMRLWESNSRLVSICDKVSANPDSFVPRPQVAEEIAAKLMDSLPSLSANLRLGRSWHCFRTYTEDQLPIWGEDPDAPGLFWLGAFGGFGMSTSFAAAFDAALYLTGKNVSVTAEFFPDRRNRAGLSANIESPRKTAVGE